MKSQINAESVSGYPIPEVEGSPEVKLFLYKGENLKPEDSSLEREISPDDLGGSVTIEVLVETAAYRIPLHSRDWKAENLRVLKVMPVSGIDVTGLVINGVDGKFYPADRIPEAQIPQDVPMIERQVELLGKSDMRARWVQSGLSNYAYSRLFPILARSADQEMNPGGIELTITRAWGESRLPALVQRYSPIEAVVSVMTDDPDAIATAVSFYSQIQSKADEIMKAELVGEGPVL